EIRRVLDTRLPGNRQRQQQGVQRQRVDQRQKPVLVEHHEADEDEATSQHVGDVQRDLRHHSPPDTNNNSVPSKPSISAIPSRLGTRKTRILAIEVSRVASSRLATMIFMR